MVHFGTKNPALSRKTWNGFLTLYQNLEKTRKRPDRRTDGQNLFYRTLPATAEGPIKTIKANNKDTWRHITPSCFFNVEFKHIHSVPQYRSLHFDLSLPYRLLNLISCGKDVQVTTPVLITQKKVRLVLVLTYITDFGLFGLLLNYVLNKLDKKTYGKQHYIFKFSK